MFGSALTAIKPLPDGGLRRSGRHVCIERQRRSRAPHDRMGCGRRRAELLGTDGVGLVEANRLRASLQTVCKMRWGRGSVFEGPFRPHGACVTRTTGD